MAYIGVQPAEAYTSFAVQHFTTSATTSYTLDNAVANENEIALFINNVRQQPGSAYAYTASGTALTLSAATSASDTMYCVFIGKAVQTVTPTLPIANFSSTGIDDNATSTAITIDSNENVAIGNTTPSSFVESSRFVVGSGTSGLNEMMFLYSGTDTYGALGFADGTSSTNRYRGMIGYDHNTDAMFISTAGGGSASRDVTVDNSGQVGIGTSSPAARLHAYANTAEIARLEGNDEFAYLGLRGTVSGSATNLGYFGFANDTGTAADLNINNAQNGKISFTTNSSEAMRIESSGNLLINKTINNFSTAGVILNAAGNCFFTASGNSGVNVNRLSDDGALVRFYQANSEEGSISVSGSTVSYNGFTGTHWSRLADNSKPTILKGTILESLDEMMDWYQVQFDITETDDEGNETTRTEKQSYALGDGESVGDVITYTYEGTDYQATIRKEGDIKHTKSKISDTVDAKNVYGVFMAWDNDDDTVNDMYVAQTGTFVVRLNSSVTTLNKGDLIQSNGDGTGKVQADDLLRASTVAKVLSTTKIETYDDGSYIVPCSLHC